MIGKLVLGSLGITAMVAAACLIVVWLEKKRPSPQYDERQKAFRGNGYRFGFWVSMAYYLVVMAYFCKQVGIQEKQIEPWLLVLFGVILQLLAWYVYCLITGAAMPFTENGAIHAATYGLMGIHAVRNFRTHGRRIPEVSLVGEGSTLLGYLMIAITAFLLAGLALLTLLRRKAEDDS